MAKNWAIAIGINQYDNLKSLKYAKKDAEAMKAWCEQEAGFDRVVLFTEDSPDLPTSRSPIRTKPTYGGLRRFLRAQFERPLLNDGDNLWFFFAGHGKRYRERDYLMLSDSDPGDIEGSALSVTWITEQLQRSGADNVVLFLDACRDEGSRDGVGIGLEEPQGVITFYACDPNKQSYEIDELQHGAFTCALLEALRMQGTYNCATVERLYDRLRYLVTQIDRRFQKPPQSPYVIVQPAPKYHLILLPQYATVRDAETMKLDAHRAERQENYELAEQLWIRVLAVSPADSDAIEAIRSLDRIRTGRKPSASSQRGRNTDRSSQPSRSSSPPFEMRFPQVSLPSVRIGRRRWLQLAGLTGASVGVSFVGKAVWDLASPLNQPIIKNLPNAETEVKLSEPFEVLTVDKKGQEIDRSTKQAQYFRENLGNDLTLDMVSIPGGTFLMGTEDREIERLVNKFKSDGFTREKPLHKVTVSPFFMGNFQITQAQWKEIASRTDLKVKSDLNSNPASFQDRSDSDRRPVERVSWSDAVEYCARLSKLTDKEYRLPSEAEWEYACRAETKTPFYFGETITGELANYDASYIYADEPKGQYQEGTTIVGKFPPNTFGLYDMHGNVWEWCADDWHKNYEGAPTDGSAWLDDRDNDNRLLRGGSWNLNPSNCRSAYRYYYPWRDYINFKVGFRVVCGDGRTV